MHQRLENWFAIFGEFISNNPLKVILFTLILIAFPISQVPKIKIDTSNEGFMHEDDPMLVEYRVFKEQFGRDERIVIGVKSDDIFTLSFLQKLKKLHTELENTLPYLDDITSLVNVRNTRGEKDQLFVDDLLEKFPKTKDDVEKIRKIVMASEFYKNLFISENGKFTTIIIEPTAYTDEKKQSIDEMFTEFDEAVTSEKIALSDEQNSQIVQKTYEIIQKYQGKDFDIYCAGFSPVMDSLKSLMKTDIQKFTKITLLIILVFLYFVFRRASATFYPLIVIILSLATTIGSMAFFGVAIKAQTQVLPSLVLAVSVGATVHVLSVFFDKFNVIKDKKEALIFTLRHSGLAIFMTGITTAVGIASFASSAVAPISDMGTFASLGVIVSLVLTLTLLPSFLMISKIKPKASGQKNYLDALMKKLSFIPLSYPKTIIMLTFLLLVVSLSLASKVKISHFPLEWFPHDNKTYIASNLLDKEMKGTISMEVIIDTKEENGWQSPQRVQKLDKITSDLEGYSDEKNTIGKIFSLNTIVKESNRALHGNDQSYYVIPDNQALLSQELLLFENSGSDDLEDVVDSQFSKVRVTHKLNWADTIDTVEIINHIESKYKKIFKDEEITITGIVPVLAHTQTQTVQSSAKSYIVAFLLITLMMIFIMGEIKMGLISMIPNLTPIILALSLMHIYKIPLDIFTFLVGPIALGLVVDDTIHFLHNFRRYYQQSGDITQAVENAFFTTGKAMVITTVVLSLGFYSYMFGSMSSVQNFGFLTGSVIIFALLIDLLLAPALMVVLAKKGWVK